MRTRNVKLARLLLGAASATIIAPMANALESPVGLFVEPAITYEVGASTTNYPSPLSNSSGSTDGFGLGARLGFHMDEAFFFGMDARYGMPYFKDSSVNYSAKAVEWNLGPVVGLQMPNFGMRLWATYILGGEMNPDSSQKFDVKFLNPTGYRVGAGFRVAQLSLNVEYKQLRYGRARLEQIGPFASTSEFDSVNLNSNSWLASLSFPLAL
jgi:hypothetical protein